jgi:hypothetical protein
MLRPHRFDTEVDPGPVQIQARKVHFNVSGIPLYWIPGYPVTSNVISLLNIVLPAAERRGVSIQFLGCCEGRDCWLAGCAAPSTRLLRRDRQLNSGAAGAQYGTGRQLRRRRRSPRFGAGLR